ncbi:precorrin-4 C(11)-methyltransferase [Halarsenatibacter silvermanii]|uniref:Cobalt-precorrin 4 C11-methyltransferase n=1 Tax=Halarsenatibacter silvermanii TaxID=321763 RepID=A0A1G9Q2G4_9FIRM|nr:precorrin-4 C(11)-methyltransferase [Halarsenatibacter silvermanii]SDM05189.1 cobalt-precorrin 4 C11-methyltransferase [Halarsenatibacter silvermanii]
METVYFVGAGPGDPELLTVRGKNLLAEADLILYAGSLVNDELLIYADESAQTESSAGMDLEEILSMIEKTVEEGGMVVRLHTGDPGLYGALQEQIDALEERGIKWEIVPGVSSFQAAGAAVGREFTQPEVSQTLILTRMEGRTSVPDRERLELLAAHKTSMVIFLSVHMINEVVEELKKEYPADTPAAVVKKASWPGEEESIKGTLDNIAARTEEAGIEKTALIMVGDFLAGDYEPSKLYDKSFSHGFREGDSG